MDKDDVKHVVERFIVAVIHSLTGNYTAFLKRWNGKVSWFLAALIWLITLLVATVYTQISMDMIMFQALLIVLMRYVARMGL